MGVEEFDVDGLRISPDSHMRHYDDGIDSLTTLASPLTPGDTSITLTDASGWNDGDANAFRRGVIIFEYKNSMGFKYDYYSRLWRRELFDVGGVDKSTNIVTLNQPFPAALGNPDDASGTWPIGTRIANQTSGNTYKYSVYASLIVPETDKWFRVMNFMGGIDLSGQNITENFSPGVSSVKLLWFPNFSNRSGGLGIYPDTGASHKFWVSGVSVTPKDNSLLIEQVDGSNTLKVPKPNLATGSVDLVDGSQTVEEI